MKRSGGGSGLNVERVKELNGLGCGPWGVIIKEKTVIPVGNAFFVKH